MSREAARLEQLFGAIPDLFQHETALYIGASAARAHYLEHFLRGGCQVTILEAYQPNAQAWMGRPGPEHVIHGDVRHVATIKLPRSRYNVAFWWHGPEHVTADELRPTLLELEKVADLVVLGCPWGVYPQGEYGGNPYEVHQWAIYPHDLESLGYTVSATGSADSRGASNLVAWKQTS